MKIKITNLSFDIEIIDDEKTNSKNKYFEKLLFYQHEEPSDFIREIKFLDEISIIESEFCVTNNDKIKYDELISGKHGFIHSINSIEKTCLINFNNKSVIVPYTWLKFIKRNNA